MHIRTVSHGDNFYYLLVAKGCAALVDAGAAEPVTRELDEVGATLELILLTHAHGDHVRDCGKLAARHNCQVVGLDTPPADGAVIDFHGHHIEVLATPGHTVRDVSFYVPDATAVFTGDTAFAGGCGRLFGGDAASMWKSLCRLRGLPRTTLMHGGHDYLLDNLEFAAHLEPGNVAVKERLAQTRALGGAPWAPSTIGEECGTNPFFRCDDPALAVAIGMPGAPGVAVFTEIRSRKDRW